MLQLLPTTIGATKAAMSIGTIYTAETEATGTEATGNGASELDQGIIGTQRITMNTITTILDFGIKGN